MHTLHKAIYAWRLVLGIAWGALLNVAGWYVLALRARSADDLSLQLLWLGVAALAAGNFVFMAIVADRVISTHRRGALDLLEFATAGLMVFAALATAAIWLRGGEM